MILITGATGLIGRRLVDLLVGAGVSTRAVTRNPAGADLPVGTDVVFADPSDPSTMNAALAGVHTLILNPRAVGAAAADLVALARARGVRRLIALSALNVDFDLERQPSRLRGEYNKEVEAAALSSGLEWVALRSGAYAANVIGTWAAQIRAGDVVRAPYPHADWAPVHERDIAAVAARAVVCDDLLGRRPVLTGPQSLTQQEMVAVIGRVLHRSLRFEPTSPALAELVMTHSGMPAPVARGFLSMQRESFGQHAVVTGEVERILGRPGLGFRDWVADHVAAFT